MIRNVSVKFNSNKDIKEVVVWYSKCKKRYNHLPISIRNISRNLICITETHLENGLIVKTYVNPKIK